MVNGALMLNNNYNLKKHIKKITNIIALTFIWGIITLLILSVISGKVYSNRDFLYALWTWETDTINHLWFLQSLACIYILFPLIKEVYDKKDKKVLIYTFFIFFIFTFGNVLLNILFNLLEFIMGTNFITANYLNFFNNFNLFKGFYAYSIVYFILGGLIKQNLSQIKSNDKMKLIILLLLGNFCLFMYGLVMSKSNGGVFDIVWTGYDTIMTLIMCIALFKSAYLIKNSLSKMHYIIELIGQNTLGIYLIHRIVGTILYPYYQLLTCSTNLIANILFGMLVMIVSLLLTLLLKKIPFFKILFKI